jgi:hypothetical protein
MSAFLQVFQPVSALHAFGSLGGLATSVSGEGRRVLRARNREIGRRQEAGHIALRTRP